MSMLRVFEKNGGKVSSNHIRISRSKKERTRDYYALRNGFEIYNQYDEEQVKSSLNNFHDWSIFEKEYVPSGFSSGKVTGISVLLYAYSHFLLKKIF